MSKKTKAAGPGLIKSTLSRLFGSSSISLRDKEFWRAYYGVDSASGKTVSQQTALQLSTVWACVRLIAETLATLPIDLYRRGDSASVIATDNPLHGLVGQYPNADQTAVEFWECVLSSLLLHGNAFIELVRSGGVVVSLEFLLPQLTTCRRLNDGSIEYKTIGQDGRARLIPEVSMMHVRGFGVDPLEGLSPIAMGRNVFGAAMAADEAASKMFANGMKLGGVLSTDQVWTPVQRNELRNDMATQFAGATNTGKTMVLEGGMKYQQVSMSPEDAQMLETRAFNVEEICRWFRVPPFMVGHTANSTSWGTGMEQQMIGFLTFTLLPWMKRIEQAANRRLLPIAERRYYFFKFNVEGLLRADSAARAAFYSAMTQNGIYTRDECRAKENLAPRGGNADKLTVQTSMAPIDELAGGGTDAQKAKAALAAWLNDDQQTGVPE